MSQTQHTIHTNPASEPEVGQRSSSTSEVAPGVHHFHTGPFNWYIIEAEGRLTLVDAGFPGHHAIFLQGLQQIGRTPLDLEAIIITHAHADHTGFAERLRLETGAAVFIHRDDVDGLRRARNLPWYGLLSNAWRPYIRAMLLHGIWQGVFTQPPVEKVVAFEDGQTLEVPGRPIVHHVPGHTPGEVAFFLGDRQVLFSGDTLVTRDLMTGAEGSPQVTHRLLNHDDQQSRRSLDRFKELGEVIMLPGHGRPWRGAMEEAVELAGEAKA